MLIPIFILVFAGATVVLYRYLVTKRNAGSLWRSSVTMGSSIGIARGVLACVGWYGVEHTGGPLQIPAFALAMLAWPEAAIFGRHQGPVPLGFYIAVAFLLIVTSMLLIGAVALMVQATRRS